MAQKKGDLIVGLDIGTTKICCIVGELTPDGIDVVGIGTHPSRGLRKGVVINFEATVASMLMTTPLRSPRDGCVPMPTTSIPSGVSSPTMQQILVVPMSRPTIRSPFFCAIPPSTDCY